MEKFPKVLLSMSEIRSIPTPPFHFIAWSISVPLLLTTLFTLLVWYLQFWYHNSWRLYKFSRNVPGPRAYPIIGCSYIFLFGGIDQIFKGIQWVFDTYPDFARFWHGHNLLYAISQPKHLQVVLKSALTKDKLYKYAQAGVGLGLFTAPLPIWKKHRKIIMPTFNQKILDSFVEIFNETSKILVEQMQPFCGMKDLDISHLTSRASLDAICETAMGIKVHAQTTDNIFGHHVENLCQLIYLRMFQLNYQIDFLFNLSSDKRTWDEALDYIKTFTSKVIKDKQQAVTNKNMTSRKVFLDWLMEWSSEQGEKLTIDELYDEVATFTIAGSDTSATTVCFILAMLGKHPEIQQKVFEEVMEVIGDNQVEPADLPKLTYMERVIKETMRLFPIAAIVVRAIEEDLDLEDGNVLPAGCSAVLGILSTHRNPKYWKDPLVFEPDRFLPEEVATRHPCTYIPFSYGPRSCAGMRYAMMSMKTSIAILVRSYKFQCGYKEISDIKLQSKLFLRATDGYKVSFEKR